MKSAVIYARYSCDAQTEQSIEGQLRVCQEYAERNGILILDTQQIIAFACVAKVSLLVRSVIRI